MERAFCFSSLICKDLLESIGFSELISLADKSFSLSQSKLSLRTKDFLHFKLEILDIDEFAANAEL